MSREIREQQHQVFLVTMALLETCNLSLFTKPQHRRPNASLHFYVALDRTEQGVAIPRDDAKTQNGTSKNSEFTSPPGSQLSPSEHDSSGEELAEEKEKEQLQLIDQLPKYHF
ncbi:unnamed protein product [Prorocentrum cordatum]|uniref:Uncharacterized protein n=1 Tax=Prorocentrum cordatum TaxID=2364126 RepID=A0ABN9UGZ5_9DINO|nr:unnamed protein product [Polarella glacialis]